MKRLAPSGRIKKYFSKKNKKFFYNLLTLLFVWYNITLVPNEQDDPLAQSVEQRTVNPCVAGSSPAGVASFILWELILPKDIFLYAKVCWA